MKNEKAALIKRETGRRKMRRKDLTYHDAKRRVELRNSRNLPFFFRVAVRFLLISFPKMLSFVL